MGETMKGLKRSHYCADIDESMTGNTVTVTGWVNKRRDLGKLIFIALRDRSGIVQITIDGNKVNDILFKKAETIRNEFVLAVKGVVIKRTSENINTNMKTGNIEIEAVELRILSESEVPPFQVTDVGVNNELRLKYRYLDLRRSELQNNIMLRHRIAFAVREFLNTEGFYEIETPVLTKSTPEGARDYLVASRVHPGNFYALPQSPQIFKQLLMVSGFDKYYQIVKCFRDEDLRADRQPEFTQIDMELSFIDVEDILDINERLMKSVIDDVMPEKSVEVNIPFMRMTYKEAMERFGSDKPDIRFDLEIKNISDLVAGSQFKVFSDALAAGGSVRGINAVGCAGFARRQLDALVDFVKDYRAKGLAWIALTENNEIKTTISKFFSEDQLKCILNAFDAKPGDLVLICADKNEIVFDSLGALRLEIAKKLGLTKNKAFKFLWVTEFPLLEWSEEDNRFYAKHHPFTAPMDEDLPLLDTAPSAVRAKAYDLVLNGTELGGGSIRIYQRDVQEKMFNTLGFTSEEANERFGFMMDAFKYGAPPHGGLAFGLDRIAMLLTYSESLRDVIAFPKVKDASCPMTEAPGVVDNKQLKELGIQIINK